MTLLLLLKPNYAVTGGGPATPSSGGYRKRKIRKRIRRWLVCKFPGLGELSAFREEEDRAVKQQAAIMRERWDQEDLAVIMLIDEIENEGGA